MRKSKFLKHINQLGEEELREELTLLFDKLPEVKTFYKFELGDTKAKEKYYTRIKNDIKSKFATRSFKKPRRPRIQKINSMLSQLRKDVVFEFELIDIYLFTVECGVNFMHEYYFQSEPLYNLILKYFEKACHLCENNLMQDQYKQRCNNIVQKLKFYKAIGEDCLSLYQDTFEN